MAQNPPRGFQRVIPYLLYSDAPAALEFLCRAFGFQERDRVSGPEGTILHAEIGYRDNVVMLATAVPDMGHTSPKDLTGLHTLVVCYVDDVDAHHDRAKAAGAKILSEPEDQFYGDRTYRALDPEGHAWHFHTHVREVPPEELNSA
jgi:PhnB protein